MIKASLFGVSPKLISDSRELVRFILGFFRVIDSRFSSIGRLLRALLFMLRASLENSAFEEANTSKLSEPTLTGSGGWEDDFIFERVLF